mgnify:CR=1 FL=1|jgi:hypothetical protein
MKIVNNKILEDLRNGTPLSINLGSGLTSKNGYYSLDIVNHVGIDIIADINEPLELIPDGSVNRVYTHHVLEHIENFIGLMRELNRIISDDGEIEIVVPHFSNVYGFSDPTHCRFFGLYSMYYFSPDEYQPNTRKVPSFYTDFKFKVDSVKIEFYKDTIFDKLIAYLFTPLINYNTSSQIFYERRLSCFFHASQLRYIISTGDM